MNRTAVQIKTPIERLLSLPETPSVIRSEGVSYRPDRHPIMKYEPYILLEPEKFDKLVSVRGPLRLRQVLELSRREMAELLAPRLGRHVSKQAVIGWERREARGVIDKYLIGRAARIAYWDLIDALQCVDGWRAVTDRRHTLHWRVMLREPEGW